MSVDSELFTSTCSDHFMFVSGSPPPTKPANVTVPLPSPSLTLRPPPPTPILYNPEFSPALPWPDQYIGNVISELFGRVEILGFTVSKITHQIYFMTLIKLQNSKPSDLYQGKAECSN